MGRQLMEREAVFLHAIEDIDSCFMELGGLVPARRAAPGGRSFTHRPNRRGAARGNGDSDRPLQAVLIITAFALAARGDGSFDRRSGGGVRSRCALSLEDAVHVIYYRSQAQNRASGKGGMLAVGLSVEEARAS